jgi:DNA mismatch repair protein MutS
MPETTPLMDQYRAIKREHSDEILFFRLGDFYEMFFEDAVLVSALLNLTLTRRQDAPMCGVPYHASSGYIARLLKLGKKIAVCEQLSPPGQGKLVERRVVEVLSPGAVVEDGYLDKGANNFLAALAASGPSLSFAFADLSTGEFRATRFPMESGGERLARELERVQPRELILQESLLDRAEIARELHGREGMVLNRYPDWHFSLKAGREALEGFYGLRGLKGFGLREDSAEIVAAGAIVSYLEGGLKAKPSSFRALRVYGDEDFVGMDESTQKSLEIVGNARDGSRDYSLLDTLDETKTAMGARELRSWLLEPLRDAEAIRARQDRVEALYRDQKTMARLRQTLAPILDTERLCARVSLDKAQPKDLLGLGKSLQAALGLGELLDAGLETLETVGGADSVAGADSGLKDAGELASLLLVAISDDAERLDSGSFIREGYDAELDEQRRLRDSSQEVLEAYAEEERASTGIPGLRIRYNKIIGYYIEISKSQAAKVPERFLRRQSLVGGERYSTERLGQIEEGIESAAERIQELERAAFRELCAKAKACVGTIARISRRIAILDCLQSFAATAQERGYCRPLVDSSGVLDIREGRHPVVEAHLPSGTFIPNDLCLNSAGASFALITGPNMAGKSTFLRQTALIVLMAQAGSFVPAREARIGLVDRLFCRVGAQDDLARGESTFLVEMSETARILNTATSRSLVVMDEVGRGTSTQDGLSIAQAVCEQLLGRLACRSLFATHYHELTRLEHPRLRDYCLDVREEDGDVVFLKRVVPGAAKGSYGIHVARLAGVPHEVLARAQELLEEYGSSPVGAPAAQPESGPRPAPPPKPAAEELFSPEEMVLSDLRSLDADAMSPLEALTRLAGWKKLLGK